MAGGATAGESEVPRPAPDALRRPLCEGAPPRPRPRPGAPSSGGDVGPGA